MKKLLLLLKQLTTKNLPEADAVAVENKKSKLLKKNLNQNGLKELFKLAV